MRKIGEEITEEMDLKPAYLFVRRYVRPRYVNREETFHIAPFPAIFIETRNKFVLHLPFPSIGKLDAMSS